MESKFHLLPIGQHFEWEGKHYIKSSPLIASELPEGGQKFMPRAAMVQVASEPPATATAKPATTLEAACVRAAIERYHQRMVQLCDSGAGLRPPALEQAYRELLGELKL